jgi:hypothetical protein
MESVGGFLGGGIDWDSVSSVHGKQHGTHSQGSLLPPYSDPDVTYVLCCTDCHEPHGSRNEWLLRTEVNGKCIPTMRWDGDWFEFCTACHGINVPGVHALDDFKPAALVMT